MTRRRIAALVGTATLTLSACGGGSEASSETSAGAVTSTSDSPAVSDTTETPSETEAGQSATSTDAEPIDQGCSTDGNPTTPDPLAGELPAAPVADASASNPLPDVTLRRINCAPAAVNLKNTLPSEKPVLYWFWAPY